MENETTNANINVDTNAEPPECATCGAELCPKCGCPTSGGPGPECSLTDHEVEEMMTNTETIEKLQARVKLLETACRESVENCTHCDMGIVRWRARNELFSKPCPCCSAARVIVE